MTSFLVTYHGPWIPVANCRIEQSQLVVAGCFEEALEKFRRVFPEAPIIEVRQSNIQVIP